VLPLQGRSAGLESLPDPIAESKDEARDSKADGDQDGVLEQVGSSLILE
jgi:hypothetical protein